VTPVAAARPGDGGSPAAGPAVLVDGLAAGYGGEPVLHDVPHWTWR
jgi:hypothetical protein